MVRLGDVGKIITGNTPATSEIDNYSSNDICFVKPSDLSNEEVSSIETSEYFISEKARSFARILPPKCVLVTCIGIIGKVGINNIECAFNQQINAIIPNTSICIPEYVAYVLHSKKHILQDMANAPVVPIINKSQFADIPINLPSLTEQAVIVEHLDKVSDLITLRKQQLAKLDELVKSRFVEMFGDVALNPNGYPVKDFDEICVLITDGEHATPRRTEEGIYLLSARNVLNHTLQLDDVDYIDEEEYNRIARRVIPQAGDVLISCSGSIGRCCVVPDGLKFQMVRSAALIRFDDTINPIFAEWLITSDDLQRQIAQSATQSSQANLFQGKIRKLHGYVPPLELQEQFAVFVEQTNKSKSEIQTALTALETLKKALMQQYFG